MNTYIVRGTTDDVTSCDCCGRQDLKSTVMLDNGSGIVYFGLVCAAKATAREAREIKADAKARDDERHEAERAALRAANEARLSLWFAFLAANGKGDDTFTRIQSLGGYAAAKALYAEAQV